MTASHWCQSTCFPYRRTRLPLVFRELLSGRVPNNDQGRISFLPPWRCFNYSMSGVACLEFLPEKLETSRNKRSILCLFIASVDQWNLRLENMLKYLEAWIRHNLNEGIMQSVYYSSEKTNIWIESLGHKILNALVISAGDIMLCDLTHKKTLWSILSSCDVRVGHGGDGRRAIAVPWCFAGFAVHLLGWVAHPPNPTLSIIHASTLHSAMCLAF